MKFLDFFAKISVFRNKFVTDVFFLHIVCRKIINIYAVKFLNLKGRIDKYITKFLFVSYNYNFD